MQSGRIASFALALATLGVTLASASCHSARGAGGGLAASTSVEPTCPPGAELGRDGCACRADLRLLLGACVAARTAAEHCGATAVATADGCAVRPPCAAGRARDLLSGECLAGRDVRNLAASLGILVADDDVLGCPEGSQLASVTGERDERSPRLGCLPWTKPAPPSLACPPGSVAASRPGGVPACTRVIERSATGGALEVDVVRWVQAAIGSDGGPGAPPLCGAWERAPGFLGSASPADARFVVSLLFADNDVSLVVAQVRGPDAAATTELDRVLRPMIEALRAFGGTASQASVTTSVRCVRSAAVRPSSVPAENDHER